MNEIRNFISGEVQCAKAMTRQVERGDRQTLKFKETTMLKTISAALLAVSMIAAPALAAGADTTKTPANRTMQTQPGAKMTATTPTTGSSKLNSKAKMIRHHRHDQKISSARSHAKIGSKVGSKKVTPPSKQS